jgi:hypothetical protein
VERSVTFRDAVIAYLRSGIEAGMTVSDPADRSLERFRVAA